MEASRENIYTDTGSVRSTWQNPIQKEAVWILTIAEYFEGKVAKTRKQAVEKKRILGTGSIGSRNHDHRTLVYFSHLLNLLDLILFVVLNNA
jgi:hypothetical protein